LAEITPQIKGIIDGRGLRLDAPIFCPEERQGQQPQDIEIPGAPAIVKADRHMLMVNGIYRSEAATQIIPVGKDNTVIAVGLGRDGGMMNPVHVWRDHQAADGFFELCRQPDIAVDKEVDAHGQYFQNDDA